MRVEHCLTCLLSLFGAYSLAEFEHVVLGVNRCAALPLGIAEVPRRLVPESGARVRVRHLQFQTLRRLACSPRRD